MNRKSAFTLIELLVVTRYPNGFLSLALEYDPPAGYEYQWSGD
jgi:hypothetical protein